MLLLGILFFKEVLYLLIEKKGRYFISIHCLNMQIYTITCLDIITYLFTHRQHT